MRSALAIAHNDSRTIMAAAKLLILIILATASSSVHSAREKKSNGSCIPAERAALFSFKAGITYDPDNRLVSWQQGAHDCCRWSGVTCSRRTGYVVKLDLHNDSPIEEDFSGAEYPREHSLHGQVSSSLIALRHLRHLDLSGNVVLGGEMAMPEFLGSLQSLTYLNLSNMGFRGMVSPQLGNLSKLIQLDIHGNYNTDLHSKDIAWLARLRSLEHLDMSYIDLSEVVGWVHTVNVLPNLVVLLLHHCLLTKSNDPSSFVHHNLTVLEELDLSYNSLNSTAAPNWFWDVTSLRSLTLWGCELSGTFPDELGNLTLLEIFDISQNNIKGMMPGTLQNMCNLRYLDLSDNNISGDITEVMDRIPNCSWNNLQELYLRSAHINGAISQFVSNLTSLQCLDFRDNQLSGSLPVEIGALTNLTSLDLGFNNLTGSMPIEIGALQNLTYLYLDHNKLIGSVPVEIGTLEKLAGLYLSSNNLSGVISEDHFTGLMNLRQLDLSHNNLEVIIDSHWIPPFNLEAAVLSNCHLGPQFPEWFRWQKSIHFLYISNTGLVGRIPDWFWATFSDAATLDISLNQLSGELPLSLEFMSVTTLSMQSNLLTGLIPKLPRAIVELDISRNSLNGFAPNFRAPQLDVAVLFSNSISGSIPSSFCRLRKLRVLDLSNNLLSKVLPDCNRNELKRRSPTTNNSSRVNSVSSFSLNITTLLLSKNNFSSGFPLFLRHCPSLKNLDLAQNKFTGELPGWIIKAMPNLVMLRLRSNNFSGRIPVEIMGLHFVRILDLSNNNFSGVIPQCMKNLKALTGTATATDTAFDNPLDEGYSSIVDSYKSLSNDSILVVIKGQVLEYRENTIYLMSIDLSCNGLTGKVPEELSSLVALINLNLSSNMLSGNIPYKIGNLRSLESLDLSKNKIGGEIPQGLSDLTYLGYLNLSYNNLSGRIPSGHQLDILETDDPASMYIGNPGLCGHPISRQCPGPPGDPRTNRDSARWHEGLSQMDFLLGLIVGFVASAWMVFCGFLFMKRWRYAYFGLVDKLYDRLYVICVVTWRKWFRNTDAN